MKLDAAERDILMKQCLNIGEGMYQVGAEIGRIEETLSRIGKAYGAEHVGAFAITSQIILTLEFPGMEAVTLSRRIRKRDAMDLARLERFMSLSRALEKEPLPVEALRTQVLDILSHRIRKEKLLLGEVLSGGAFALFFGGSPGDAAAAALICLLIYLFQEYVQPLCKSRMFFNLLISFMAGSCALLLTLAFPALNPDMISIGNIMVLIPGVAITNSLRYTLSGDSISGLEKLIDSVLLALGVAAGYMLALYLLPSVSREAAVYPAWLQMLLALAGTLGFCLIFNLEWRHMPAPVLGGALSWGLFIWLSGLGLGLFMSTLLTSAAVGLYGELCAHLLKTPTTLYFIPCSIPLIPGGCLYYTLSALLFRRMEDCSAYAGKLLLYLLGIALGIGLVTELEEMRRRLHARPKKSA